MMQPQSTLLVFEDQLDDILEKLKTKTIRMASSRSEPWNPLREGKEISLDSSGKFVLPDPEAGISLASSLGQLQRIWRTGRKNYLFTIDRNTRLEDGFAFNEESIGHWMIIVTKKMTVEEFESKVKRMAQTWKLMGRYIKNA